MRGSIRSTMTPVFGVSAIIVAAAITAQVALAGVNPSTTPVGCGTYPDDQGISQGSWGTSGFAKTENDSQYCEHIYTDGHVRIGSTYYYFDGTWHSGHPTSATEVGYGSVVEVGGIHNACLSDWTGCNGFANTLAYQ